MLSTTKRSLWTNEALEAPWMLIERDTFLKEASKSCNIPMNSFFYYMNGKAKSRNMGPRDVLIEKECASVIAWTLTMH